MLLGHLFGPEGVGTFNGIQEILQFLLFPIGMGAGLIIAWKWEGLGGLITIASIIAFHAIRLVMYGQADFGLWIDGLAGAGVLFVVCWFLSRVQADKAD